MGATLRPRSTTSRTKAELCLLKVSVAGHGGARNATTLYQGGDVLEVSWFVRNWPWCSRALTNRKGTSSRDKSPGRRVQVRGSDLNALFGKSDEG